MSSGVSVIICCHNSAKRLPETLAHLAAQKVTRDVPWEIILVDNASTDGTAATAASLWPKSPPAPLRIVTEPEPGLSHARLRGINEAQYEIISFVDDDNWMPKDWIERVEAIFAAHPEVGAAGGSIAPVFEVEKPSWFDPIEGYYAVGHQHAQSGDITDSTGTLLCGAGLCLRAEAVRTLFKDGFVFRMTGRKEGRLLTGEDAELCFALRASDWRLWYEDDLVLRHFIPKERLQWNYVVRLMRGVGESSALFALYLCALNAPPYTHYPMWKRAWSFQFVKALQQLVRVFILHPLACLRPTENSFETLEYENLKNRVGTFWRLRRQYDHLQQEIQKTAWAQRKR